MADNKEITVAARMTVEEKEALVKYCKKNDLSMSQVLRRAIKEFLNREAN